MDTFLRDYSILGSRLGSPYLGKLPHVGGYCLGFRALGLGCGIWGLGFRVQGLGCRVQGRYKKMSLSGVFGLWKDMGNMVHNSWRYDFFLPE